MLHFRQFCDDDTVTEIFFRLWTIKSVINCLFGFLDFAFMGYVPELKVID